jgi:hypothetical protein
MQLESCDSEKQLYTPTMLNKVLNIQVSDTTGVDSSNLFAT